MEVPPTRRLLFSSAAATTIPNPSSFIPMDNILSAAGVGTGATKPLPSPSLKASSSAAAAAAPPAALPTSPSPPLSVSNSSPSRSPSPPPSGPTSVPSPPAEAAELPPPPPSASSRRLAVPCWVHEETLALIDAYREKWCALRRRNLRASDWQDVADDLARRCPVASVTGAAASSTPKTSVQCRHKVEKLRKRYRSERRKALQRNPYLEPNSSWVYFSKMEELEWDSADGAPGSAIGLRRPPASLLPPPSDDEDYEDEDNGEDRHYNHRRGPGGSSIHTRSLHHLMSNGGGSFADDGGGLRFAIPKAVRSRISRVDERPATASPKASPLSQFFKGHDDTRPAMEEMRWKLEKQRRRKKSESEAVAEMVSSLRALGDGFLRMEQRKMEMTLEMEKARMEMALKRTELILDSQRQIVDAFLKGFRARKRAKISRQD